MIEQRLIEYLANGIWQIPLLAAGTWMLLRMIKPGPAVQHRVWLAVLGLALVLPLRGAVDRQVQADIAQSRTIAVQQGATLSPDAFDAVGQPGGLVLGHQRAGAWPGLSSLTVASRVRRVQLNGTAVHWIAGLYLATGLIGLIRLVGAWRRARRLVIESRVIALTGRELAAISECARRIGSKAPQVRQLHLTKSRGISGPVVVGAIKPVMLWRDSFARDLIAQDREDLLMAALCHEMAHIRRHDYLMNLLCEAAALPLKWHPVTYAIEKRIRTTREMACDDMAAGAMESETKYAKCLLSLAQSLVAAGGTTERATGSVAAVGLFSDNVLEERVMRLMQAKTSMSMRAKTTRAVAGGAAMTAAFVLATIFHVVPAAAQAEPAASQSTTTAASAPQAAITDPAAAQTEAPGPGAGSSAVAPVPPVPSAPSVAPAPIPPAPSVAPSAALAPVAPIAPDELGPQAAPKPSPVPGVAPPTPHAPIAPASHHTECKGREMFAIVNGKARKLTPEEKRKVEQQLTEARAKIAAATAKLNSPEFRKQMDDAQHQAIEAERKLNSGEFQKQMEDAQRQVVEATAKLNSPEFRKQIADAQKLAADAAVNNAEFQKRMADAQQQIAEAKAKLNSPEFRQQLEDAQRKAIEAEKQIDSAEFQKQMADAQQQLADALARMTAEQSDTEKK